MFEGPIHWTDYLRAVGPTFIAIFVAFIAYQQWKVNQATLKERLFERRMAIFKETQAYLSEILREASISDDSMWKFNDTHQRSRFLFGKKIQNYLIEIRHRSIQMMAHKRQYAGLPVGEERNKGIEKEHVELNWLNDQIDVIFDKFEPYLGFEKHK